MFRRLSLLIALALLASAPPAAAAWREPLVGSVHGRAAPPPAAAWRAPVAGPVVGRFAVGPDPFAPGQRRGIDLAGPAGTPVVAPCSGRVAFAGGLPGRGRGVSIRCGALTATVMGLAAPVVRAGALVEAGDRLGRVGAAGLVRLGARRTTERFGYRDPLTLLGADARPVPPLPAAPGPRARRGPAGPRLLVADRSSVPARPHAAVPVSGPAATRVPLVAWLGLALVAVALPAGTLAGGGRRGRRAQRAATVAK
jgi:murein DD-endopeptidase MepM/ murein hydrolase activator NlpD